jgi:excisionase family DNA binding protein
MTETAELLGCTTRTIRQMVADGRLRAYRLGPKFVRLRSDEVLAALQPYGGAA